MSPILFIHLEYLASTLRWTLQYNNSIFKVMKTKKSEFEYPEMNGTVNTMEKPTLPRTIKGKKVSAKESQKQPYKQSEENIKIAGIPMPVRKNKLKGLCGNCDYADTCIYPKPVTGVWHCNEYH